MEYRIIIAEDEEIERTALQLILHTHMPQLKIVAQTNNGFDLLKLCKQEHPHIVLLDINMPQLNGLDAIEQVIKNNPSTHFIILSAHADFSYAQRALKLGADDYLTKPLKTELLISALNRLIKKLEVFAQDTVDMTQISKKMQLIQPQIEYNIMQAFISGQISNTIKEQFYFLFEKNTQYLCLLVRSADIANKTFHSPELFQLLRKKLLLFSNNLIVQDTGILHFLVLSINTEKVVPNIHQYLYELRSFLNMLYQNTGSTSVHIYVGQPVSTIEELLENYKKLSQKYMQQQKKDCVLQNSGFSLLFSSEQNLINSIVRGDYHVSLQLVEKIFLILKEKSSGSLNMFKDYLRDSLSIIQRGISTKFLNAEYIQTLYENFFFLLKDIEHTDTLKLEFQNFIISCCEYCCMHAKSSSADIDVYNLQQYIEQNYMRDISLEQLAEKYKTSISYLSKLIKSQLGKNYVEYITDLRIQKAKELLVNTTKSIREVSLEIGYNSQTYFCKVFKRCVGVNASEYKKWQEKD